LIDQALAPRVTRATPIRVPTDRAYFGQSVLQAAHAFKI
jgi:hypothetical protein